MFESLESRRLYSGVVTVTTDYGSNHTFRVQGDDAVNSVVISAGFRNGMEEELPTYSIQVYGGRLIVDGVEIAGGKHSNPVAGNNGSVGVAFFGSASIDLGGGDDSIRLVADPDNELGTIELETGDGNDRISSDGGFSSLKINSGAGDDRVALISNLAPRTGYPFFRGISGVAGDLNIFGGAGRDRISLEAGNELLETLNTFLIGGKLRIIDNSGSTQIGLQGVRAKRGVTISTGNSADYLSFKHCYLAEPSVFVTRGGDDVIRIRQLRLDQSQNDVFLTGSGRDMLLYV
ncbi:MAG: hypothetical protein JWM57_3747 [Phycisphaerales bacterium]|nr:hypothetical protein [Phycisphaerales bacterium]